MKEKDREEFEEIFQTMLQKVVPGLVQSIVANELAFLTDYDKKIHALSDKFETKFNEVKTKYDELAHELQSRIQEFEKDIDKKLILTIHQITEGELKDRITKNTSAILELAEKIFSLKDKTLEAISEREKLEEETHDLKKLVSPHRDAIERLHTLNQLISQGAGTLMIDTLRSQLETVRDKIQMEQASAPFITLVLRTFREIVNELNREREPLEVPALMRFKNKIDELISDIKDEEAKSNR